MVLCLSPGHGGLELYAAREVEVLHERGVACEVVASPGSRLAGRLEGQGIPIHPLQRRGVFPVLAAWRLARMLEAQAIDVLHIHWARDLPLAALAKKFTRRPVRLVYSRHMALTRSKRDGWHRWQYRQVDCLLTVTKQLASQAAEYLPMEQDRIRTLYLGVKSPDPKKADCRVFFEQAGFARRKLNVALFGRIEPYKGQHVLIEAMAGLVRSGHDVSATIVGHVMDRDYAQQLARAVADEALETHVRFVDFVPDAASKMACFDVVVLTTECETFGLVLVEAMQAGVAVIGTNCGGVKEIITGEEVGYLFESGNSADLRNKILDIYTNPIARKRIAKNGIKLAQDNFSESIHFNKLMKIFKLY